MTCTFFDEFRTDEAQKGIDCVSELGLSKFEVISYYDFECVVLSLRSVASFPLYFCFASRISVVTAFRFCLIFVHVAVFGNFK